jgi:hypothetical protein
MSSSTYSSDTEQEGTKARRFLALRGHLLFKEMKEIGILPCKYGAKLKVSTQIIAIARSTNPSSVSYSVNLTLLDASDNEIRVYLDLDEIEEATSGLGFIWEAAQKFVTEQRDYTEFIYSSKDGVQFGFFQQTPEQTGFVSGPGKILFIEIAQLLVLKQLIEKARQHLEFKQNSPSLLP